MLSVTLEIQSNRNGLLEGTSQIEMGGMAGYLANLDQSNIEHSQAIDSSSYFYQDDNEQDHEEVDVLSMSALAKQITNIGSINIQELEAKIQEDEEDFRQSSLEPSLGLNQKRKKSSVLVPALNMNMNNLQSQIDVNIEEYSESEDEMDTNRDREFFMEQAAKEKAEELERARAVMEQF